jgi:hypothetical protein
MFVVGCPPGRRAFIRWYKASLALLSEPEPTIEFFAGIYHMEQGIYKKEWIIQAVDILLPVQ